MTPQSAAPHFIWTRPVSYTHLDVYKRQIEGNLMGSYLKRLHTASFLRLVHYTQDFVFGDHQVFITCQAVSYTHLDVYKRQQSGCPAARTGQYR